MGIVGTGGGRRHEILHAEIMIGYYTKAGLDSTAGSAVDCGTDGLDGGLRTWSEFKGSD